MINIIDHKSIDKIFTIGDIHGEFKTIFNSIKRGLVYPSGFFDEEIHPLKIKEYEDFYGEGAYRIRPIPHFEEKRGKTYQKSVFIVVGDCGIGFNKTQYYIDLFKKMNETLEKNDSFLYFLRGNHDDPSYFNEDKLGFSNIKCISDYTVILFKKHNVLCVGGGVSIDRVWRKQQEIRLNKYKSEDSKKRLYWDDEMPIYDEEKLKEMIESNIEISHVVSHTSPLFAFPKDDEEEIKWFEVDLELKGDILKERQIMSNIYDYLNNNGVKLKTWTYGHYHKSFREVINETVFSSSNEFEINNIIHMYGEYMKINEMKKRKSTDKYFKPFHYDSLFISELEELLRNREMNGQNEQNRGAVDGVIPRVFEPNMIDNNIRLGGELNENDIENGIAIDNEIEPF